jgi:hypothetical protein
MVRWMILIGLAICLVPAGLGCLDKDKPDTTRTRTTAKRTPLIDSYNPKKTVERIRVTKGEGEGAKVSVYTGPSEKNSVIGRLNFGTEVELIKEEAGWYGVRYISRDGGEFFGWIQIAQARYIGTQDRPNEVIPVEDENKKANLTLQESDDEMLAILSVPYKLEYGAADSEPKKVFWSGKDPDGVDDVHLLVRIVSTSETKRWAQQCRSQLWELGGRAHPNYRPVLQAYYDALEWYVKDNKAQFTQMLKIADEKRTSFARHFTGN